MPSRTLLACLSLSLSIQSNPVARSLMVSRAPECSAPMTRSHSKSPKRWRFSTSGGRSLMSRRPGMVPRVLVDCPRALRFRPRWRSFL